MGLWCFQRDMTSAQPAMFVIAAGKCSETSYMLAFICGIFMLLSFPFFQRFSHFDQILPDKVYWLSGRLLPISSKMLSTAFTFSALKKTLGKGAKNCKRKNKLSTASGTGSPKNLLALTRHWFFINNSNKDFCIYMLYRITFFQTTLSNQAQLECFVWLFGRLNPREDHKHSL